MSMRCLSDRWARSCSCCPHPPAAARTLHVNNEGLHEATEVLPTRPIMREHSPILCAVYYILQQLAVGAEQRRQPTRAGHFVRATCGFGRGIQRVGMREDLQRRARYRSQGTPHGTRSRGCQLACRPANAGPPPTHPGKHETKRIETSAQENDNDAIIRQQHIPHLETIRSEPDSAGYARIFRLFSSLAAKM